MTRQAIAVLFLAAWSLGCPYATPTGASFNGGDGTGTGGGGGSGGGGGGGGGGGAAAATFGVGDPSGDTFGTGSPQWDVDSLVITRDSTGITIRLVFSASVVSPLVDPQNAVYAVVDLDTDQNPATGVEPDADFIRQGAGSSGIGADYEIDLVDVNPDSSFSVFDTTSAVVGTVRATFAGRTLSLRVPLTMLGNDDGLLDVVADAYAQTEPTDVVPNNGSLRVGP